MAQPPWRCDGGTQKKLAEAEAQVKRSSKEFRSDIQLRAPIISRSHARRQADNFRAGFRDRLPGVLRAGKAEPLVCTGVCGSVRFEFGVWIPAGRVAVWTRRNCVDDRGDEAVAIGSAREMSRRV